MFLVFFMSCLFLVGQTVNATSHDAGGPAPINPATGAGGCATGSICNPLQSTSIEEFILKIIDVLLVFALPIIVLYIMYAGFLFVTANGNESQLTQAKNALLWSVVGGVIALGAKLILEVIQGTVAVF
jgi:hypothetical protein